MRLEEQVQAKREIRARPTVWAHQGHTNSSADDGTRHISMLVYLTTLSPGLSATLSSWRVASALPFYV